MTTTEFTDTNLFATQSNVISVEDMENLLESLKLDVSKHLELQNLVQRAKEGEPIQRDTLMNIVTAILAADTEHLDELTNTIGDFEIQLK
ncbi:MAG: hypothetical protein EXX96DRAFT_651818 [Benjaminiella poitrasii]|nr:MAG: hypothetical protein EXX96DRAFT_651818 [Benjaminiella poitrasii]